MADKAFELGVRLTQSATCDNGCGTPLLGHFVARDDYRYCSSVCATLHQRNREANAAFRVRLAAGETQTAMKNTCDKCGGELGSRICTDYNIFCSERCRDEYFRQSSEAVEDYLLKVCPREAEPLVSLMVAVRQGLNPRHIRRETVLFSLVRLLQAEIADRGVRDWVDRVVNVLP